MNSGTITADTASRIASATQEHRTQGVRAGGAVVRALALSSSRARPPAMFGDLLKIRESMSSRFIEGPRDRA